VKNGTFSKAPSEEDDDMQLNDKVKIKDWVRKRWPKDAGLADGAISVNTAFGSGYAYSRIAAEGVERLVPLAGAQGAAIRARSSRGSPSRSSASPSDWTSRPATGSEHARIGDQDRGPVHRGRHRRAGGPHRPRPGGGRGDRDRDRGGLVPFVLSAGAHDCASAPSG